MKGTAWKFGDDIDTDIIIPGRYLIYTDEERLSAHCMEGLDPDFDKKCKKGDFIVGGKNFGCGSSREHAPIALKGLGVSAVITESFARIFYRNSINIGLGIVECPEAAEEISEGDIVEADMDNGIIYNRTTGKQYKTAPFPEFIQKIIENGGLIQSIADGVIK